MPVVALLAILIKVETLSGHHVPMFQLLLTFKFSQTKSWKGALSASIKSSPIADRRELWG